MDGYEFVSKTQKMGFICDNEDVKTEIKIKCDCFRFNWSDCWSGIQGSSLWSAEPCRGLHQSEDGSEVDISPCREWDVW